MASKIIWDDFSERKDDRDLGLEIEGQIFWVSRQELADSSPVFKAMFYGEFEESKNKIIQLPQKSAKDILELLRCLFPTGTICKAVDDDKVELLLSLADEYEIAKLMEKCSKFLITKIKQSTEDEKIDLFITGVQYKLKDVVRGTIMEVRKSGATEISGFDDMPPEVKNAITMSLINNYHRHQGEFKLRPKTSLQIYDAYLFICKFCYSYLQWNEEKAAGRRRACLSIVDEVLENENDPCSVCRFCRMKIQCDDKTVKTCQCIHPSILDELMKASF